MSCMTACCIPQVKWLGCFAPPGTCWWCCSAANTDGTGMMIWRCLDVIAISLTHLQYSMLPSPLYLQRCILHRRKRSHNCSRCVCRLQACCNTDAAGLTVSLDSALVLLYTSLTMATNAASSDGLCGKLRKVWYCLYSCSQASGSPPSPRDAATWTVHHKTLLMNTILLALRACQGCTGAFQQEYCPSGSCMALVLRLSIPAETIEPRSLRALWDAAKGQRCTEMSCKTLCCACAAVLLQTVWDCSMEQLRLAAAARSRPHLLPIAAMIMIRFVELLELCIIPLH